MDEGVYPEGEVGETFGQDVFSSIAMRDVMVGVEWRRIWIRDIIGSSSSAVEAVMLMMKGFARAGTCSSASDVASVEVKICFTHPM
jgi:hypothetical protein